MIKKTFSTLAAFLLGAVISITVVACADDLKEFVECNCNDTIKELFAKIDGFEDRIVKIEKIDYDSLAQIVFQRINTNNTINNCDCEETIEELRTKLATLEKDISSMQATSTLNDIKSYSTYSEGMHMADGKYEYDDKNRLSRFERTEYNETGISAIFNYTFTYTDNECQVFRDGYLKEVFRFDDSKNNNYEIIKLMYQIDQ